MAGIYKAYDIRGITGKDLDEGIAYWIGRAFVAVTGSAGKKVLVGRDMRPSSVPLSAALIRGITDAGAGVVDAGLVSTPLFYYATKTYAAGVMVTASHNPKEYNGFKFCKEEAIPISYETGIDEIERIVTGNGMDEGDRGEVRRTKKGTVTQKEFLEEFLRFNLSFLTAKQGYRIAVDTANGMGGLTYGALAPLLKERGIELLPLYFELDGNFPNHEANPLKEETLAALKELVRKEEADFGLAIDGDGDRCVFVDGQGETVSADLFLALIAEELLKRHRGATILHDLRCSRIVRERIAAAGGKALMCRVGHAYIKAQMREEQALLAGEVSGHFYPGEANYTENTMYALFQLLNLLDETGKSLGELVAPLRKYAYSGEINSTVQDADAALAAVEEKYVKLPGIADLSHLDGLRIEWKDWWFNVRKSNTEPVVRLIVEAETREEMERRRDELLALIRG